MNGRRFTVVINLKHRVDRRVAMEEQLSRVGWEADFFPAIRPEKADEFPSIGARGCFLSHLSVLKNARDSRAQHLIVLEDDLNFTPDFVDQWKLSFAALERLDWSIF